MCNNKRQFATVSVAEHTLSVSFANRLSTLPVLKQSSAQQRDRETGGEGGYGGTARQTDRQTDRHTDRQTGTDRHIDTHTETQRDVPVGVTSKKDSGLNNMAVVICLYV